MNSENEEIQALSKRIDTLECEIINLYHLIEYNENQVKLQANII